MKISHLAFLLIFLISSAYSQISNRILDENKIVKDSSGYVYPYAIWRALVNKGYSLRPLDPKNKNSEFLLIKLTEKQLAYRLEKMPKPTESKYFTTGEKIKLFKTRDINNDKLNLKEYPGKVIVLNFWFIDCPPCRQEIPDLNELVEKYKNNDSVKFVAVALDDSRDLKEFLKKIPFNYTIVDKGKYIADSYGIMSYPTHVIVNAEGKVYFHSSGVATNTVHWLQKTIDELLNAEKK
jgi:thiol-disulfide isomerase/thioredoxin